MPEQTEQERKLDVLQSLIECDRSYKSNVTEGSLSLMLSALKEYSIERLEQAAEIYISRFRFFSLSDLIDTLDNEVPLQIVRRRVKTKNDSPRAFQVWCSLEESYLDEEDEFDCLEGVEYQSFVNEFNHVVSKRKSITDEEFMQEYIQIQRNRRSG